jgi:hypothetical protein
VHAVKVSLGGLTQVEVGEEFPDTNRQIANEGILDFAPASHEPGQGNAWNSICQKEVQILLGGDFLNNLFHFHFPVTNFK